jgi:asparagine synthetase B (glutamine-hydrolysing)
MWLPLEPRHVVNGESDQINGYQNGIVRWRSRWTLERYLYFHKAPNAREFHEENVRKLGKLHVWLFACDKSLAAWGIEGRVPFLDKEFMDVAMRNPQDKMINAEHQWKNGSFVKLLKRCCQV